MSNVSPSACIELKEGTHVAARMRAKRSFFQAPSRPQLDIRHVPCYSNAFTGRRVRRRDLIHEPKKEPP